MQVQQASSANATTRRTTQTVADRDDSDNPVGQIFRLDAARNNLIVRAPSSPLELATDRIADSEPAPVLNSRAPGSDPPQRARSCPRDRKCARPLCPDGVPH